MKLNRVNEGGKQKILMAASVASMIDQFNVPNIRLLQNMGYEVHVICNFVEGNTCDGRRIRKFQKKLQCMNVIQHQWDCPRNVWSVKSVCMAYWQLWKVINKHHFAWIHCHSPAGSVLARTAAHRQGIKIIYTAHGFHFYKGAPIKNWLMYYPAEKLLSYWTDILITVNREDYGFAKRHLRAGKIRYIPGIGIDTACFKMNQKWERQKICRKYFIPEDGIILLSVGELSRRKNHKIVISVLAELVNKDIYYLICGQGDLKNELLAFAQKKEVADRIRMLGFQEDTMELYDSADIFVFPSLQEGMPVALMEAMAAGLPCVVSDIRGSRELICDETGRNTNQTMRNFQYAKPGGARFSLKRPEELRVSLELLLKNKRLRQACGLYNQKRIREYDLSRVQGKMKKIYFGMKIKDEKSE